MKFRLLVDFEVLDFALKLSASRRRRLFDHFLEIQKFPGNYSDFLEEDGRGRSLHVSLLEDLRIQYWIDDADRHVKILQIVENE